MERSFVELPASIAALPESWHTLYAAAPEIVTRQQLHAMSGGAFAVGTLANRDSQGTGPNDAFLLGKRACYTREAAVCWLAEQSKMRK